MNKDVLLKELHYKAIRSSGAGGQNVNKVSSKVVLNFDLENSFGLDEDEKAYLKEKLATRLTQDFILILYCDEDRSQLKNKTIITKRFLAIIEKGLKKPKIRKATKATKASKERRLKIKKNTSFIKQNRKKFDM